MSLVFYIVCISLILTGGVPSTRIIKRPAVPVFSNDLFYGRLAGLFLLAGYIGIPVILIGFGLIFLIIGIVKAIDGVRTIR
ncbi:hypothetical protein K8I28_05175 [bacterium]|nr:hypothetical protein [bacterium]